MSGGDELPACSSPSSPEWQATARLFSLTRADGRPGRFSLELDSSRSPPFDVSVQSALGYSRKFAHYDGSRDGTPNDPPAQSRGGGPDLTSA